MILLLVATGAVAITVRRVRAGRRRARAADSAAAALPELLELLVALVRAGCSPQQAVHRLQHDGPGPLLAALHAVDARLAQGLRFADALGELARVHPAAQPAVDLLATAERYGLPLAPVLDRLADEARMQRRRQAEAAARELPVRLAMPLVCCTLPSVAVLTVVPVIVAALGSLPSLGP